MGVPKLKVSGEAGDSRMTPKWLVDELARRYAGEGAEFKLDVCATATSAKALLYFDVELDGLAQSWGGYGLGFARRKLGPIPPLAFSFFCNPPWSNIEPWVAKGIDEVLGPEPSADVGVYVLPARLSSAWWPELARWAEVLKPIRGRVQFPPEDPSVKSSSNPEATVYAVLRRDIVRPK